jgi:hypothetical protein
VKKSSLKDQQLYRRIYKDIVTGFSVFKEDKSLGERNLYIKHFKELDHGELEESTKIYIDIAVEKGLLKEADKLLLLYSQEHWTTEEEGRVQILRAEKERYESTIKQLFLKSQKKGVEIQLKEVDKELNALLDSRTSLLDLTAEKWAEKKKNEEFIRASLFSDSELKGRAYSNEEYDEMQDTEFASVIMNYNSTMGEISQLNIKRIAVLPFFMNSFFICKDSPLVFFGKPAVDLTMHQLDLFSRGIFGKNVLSRGSEPPEIYYEDLDKLINWYESEAERANAEANKQSGKGSTSADRGAQAMGLVGATKDEIEAYAKQQGGDVVNLKDAADKLKKELGKDSLNTMDMARLHGL